MLSLQTLIIASVAMPFAAALVLSLRRPTTSSALPTDRWRLLAALALLAVGAVVWLATEVNMPPTLNKQSTWPLSLLLGLLAVLVAARPRMGRLVMLATAVAAPILAIVGMALIFAFGSGVSNGGSSEPFAAMALVAVIGTAAAYTAPAVATAALLRPRAAMTAGVSPGWYPDPASEGSHRYWDGSSWTDQINAAEEQPSSTTAAR